jgi:hypothetical protein
VLTAQIGAESNFMQGVGSPAGAQDIAQFMPGTAPGYGVRLGDNKIKDDIRGQVRYMLPLLRKHGIEGALRGYNAGVGAIERSKGFSETNSYVRKVRGSAGRYRGLTPGGGGNDGLEALLIGGGSSGVREIAQGADVSALLAALSEKPQPVNSGGLAPPAFSAQAVMPQGSGVPQGGGGPAPKPDVNALLEAVRTVGGGVSRGGAVDPVSAALGGSTGGAPGRVPSRLRGADRLVEGLAARHGAPITANDEPGHAVGGDHDPSLANATADDIGGSEKQRRRIFNDLTRTLGVRGTYGGADINITRNGIRYQIISRPHGTGPHLHVGMRRVGRRR